MQNSFRVALWKGQTIFVLTGRSFFALYIIVHSVFDHVSCRKILIFIV